MRQTMQNKKSLLIALYLSAICATVEANTLARDYTMVDLHNRLTTKMIDVGTTSITISVEWPLDIEIESRWLDLMGKWDIKKRGWDSLADIDFDKTQGKVVVEILYDEMPWSYHEDMKLKYEKKAFFAVRIPIPQDSPWGPFRGKYEADDEVGDKVEEAPPTDTAGTEAPPAEKDVAQVSPPPPSNRNETTDIVKPTIADTYNESEPPEEKPNRLWLYLVLPLSVLGAVVYFMRKKAP